MAKREKRLKKQERGLLKQAQKHLEKLETEDGRKDTTHKYWEKEIKRYKSQAKERAGILKKLEKKKHKKIVEFKTK